MLKLEKLHGDDRGEIYLITGDGLKEHKEITLFVTNKGYARGGCVHHLHDECCAVLEGEISYRINGDISHYQKGESLVIPKSNPHYFISKTDSIVLEWGCDPEEKKEKE
jgi:mannose-6-phosphate isomerase-like protein (cupin superfamily)